MELSSEDNLRLNVLIRQALQAVRIDESKMVVHALTPKGEATVPLHPTGRDDLYLKKVRELFSTQVLGSPGGYPVYIKRWTRSGQAREDDSLRSLLLLGEPEAVVAVIHSPDLSPTLAELAWWAMPEANTARRLLEKPQVAVAAVGQELAAYLIEFLPFETEPREIQDSVRLVLQPGLADESVRADLWRKAARKGAYYIGFLQASPDALPEPCAPHRSANEISLALAELLATNNPAAVLLCKVLSAQGQAFLKTAEAAMGKLANQDATVALFNTIGRYFSAARPAADVCRDSDAALAMAKSCVLTNVAVREVLAVAPEWQAQMVGLLTLALTDEDLLDSFFSHSDAVGPLMRRKLTPWTAPLVMQMQVLRE